MHSAIEAICDSWGDAIDAAYAIGFRGGSDEIVMVSGGSINDPTGQTATQEDSTIAARWLTSARACLVLLLRVTSADVYGESCRTGAFVPQRFRRSLLDAADEFVETWPKNAARLIERIHVLANTARREWPAMLRPGDVAEGVKVGARLSQVEICAECGKVVAGGAGDPIVRIDGKPHHKSPCYYRVWRRSAKLLADGETAS